MQQGRGAADRANIAKLPELLALSGDSGDMNFPGASSDYSMNECAPI
jgi:hypothetical protein